MFVTLMPCLYVLLCGPKIRNKDSCILYLVSCHRLFTKLHAPAEDQTGDPLIYSLALYHVAVKAGLYPKAVQVYYIPNLYPVTLFCTYCIYLHLHQQQKPDIADQMRRFIMISDLGRFTAGYTVVNF